MSCILFFRVIFTGKIIFVSSYQSIGFYYSALSVKRKKLGRLEKIL